mmetsp:Transcript_41656/g.79592  ORF Transcript_41656/g.79592 Transcript_41656/m.79592 type:complete len:403 (-) Transcript_41656:486-1694(-)
MSGFILSVHSISPVLNCRPVVHLYVVGGAYTALFKQRVRHLVHVLPMKSLPGSLVVLEQVHLGGVGGGRQDAGALPACAHRLGHVRHEGVHVPGPRHHPGALHSGEVGHGVGESSHVAQQYHYRDFLRQAKHHEEGRVVGPHHAGVRIQEGAVRAPAVASLPGPLLPRQLPAGGRGGLGVLRLPSLELSHQQASPQMQRKPPHQRLRVLPERHVAPPGSAHDASHQGGGGAVRNHKKSAAGGLALAGCIDAGGGDLELHCGAGEVRAVQLARQPPHSERSLIAFLPSCEQIQFEREPGRLRLVPLQPEARHQPGQGRARHQAAGVGSASWTVAASLVEVPQKQHPRPAAPERLPRLLPRQLRRRRRAHLELEAKGRHGLEPVRVVAERLPPRHLLHPLSPGN